MTNKSKMKKNLKKLKKLKSMVTDLKAVAIKAREKDNELIDIYEQHIFEHSLINFDEPFDEWNMRDILPAFPSRNCYIPIPPDSGSSSGMRDDYKSPKIKK